MLLVVLAAMLGAACRPAPQREAPAAGPAAAVEQLAGHLRRDDLVGFARAAVPAGEYARLAEAWREGRSRWPLTELPLDEQWVPLLAALSAPEAERELGQVFERQIAGQHLAVRQAAQLLGRFASEYIRQHGDYPEPDRTHYLEVVAALEAWAERAPLADPKRAPPALARLARQARATGLRSEADLRAAGMEESLRRLGPFFAELKSVLADYGLPLQESLSNLTATMVEEAGDLATVRVEYPLAGRRIGTTAVLLRREGRWYLEGQLRRAAQALAAAQAEADTEAGGDAADSPGASAPGPRLGDNVPDA